MASGIATKLTIDAARRLLPGVPVFENPFFDDTWIDTLGAHAFQLAVALRQDGYALIDIDIPDFAAMSAAIIERLSPEYDWDTWHGSGKSNMRLQDAWRTCPEVGELAGLESVVTLLSAAYGRPMFPFQTLNFACGSQQHLHADAVHFNTLPDGWMCGVWVALEDVDADNGPLLYAPGSHRYRFAQNLDIGLFAEEGELHQSRFHALWDALAEQADLKVEQFLPRRGQALVWSAHLMHGGDRHRVPDRTRWSQVTHFYGEGCLYLTPISSNVAVGPIAIRSPQDIRSGERVTNTYLGARVDVDVLQTLSAVPISSARFDADAYLRLNPDVAAAGIDPYDHYLEHGRFENRRIC